MYQYFLVLLLICYTEIALTSLWGLSQKPSLFIKIVISANAIIFPPCASHYFVMLFCEINAVQESSLIAPSIASVIAAGLWNPWTLNKAIAYQQELETAKKLTQLKDKHSLIPEVILRFEDYNVSRVVSINQAMIDWFVGHNINGSKALTVGVNWWDILQGHPQWKIDCQECANGKIFSNKPLHWEAKNIWLLSSMFALDYDQQTYVITLVDDSESQIKIKALEEKNVALEAENVRVTNINKQLLKAQLIELEKGSNPDA